MNRFIEHIESKAWTAQYIDLAVGNVRQCMFAYASDENLRSMAASGGSVSAILIHLLKSGEADGALIVASQVVDGQLLCGFKIARTAEDVLAARGSKYMPVHFNREVPDLIRSFNGRIAAVLLPCDAQALARLRAVDSSVDAKICFVITLFCGHNSERDLTEAVIARHRPKNATLTHFQHRFGHWRGNMRMSFSDGSEVVRPFADFSVYQNLFFFSQKKCHACFDHFGFNSDLAAGDIWSQKMKHDPVKKNAIVIRSAKAERVISDMIENSTLCANAVGIQDVCNGQSRALPFHYNISARARVGALFGMRLRDTTKIDAKWNEIAAAFLVMVNERMTRSRIGRWIVLRIPRQVLKAYLVVLKGLETI